MFDLHSFKMSISGSEVKVAALLPRVEEVADTPAPVGSVHHILVADISGSMHYNFEGLKDAVHHAASILRKTDYLSVYWYASDKDNGCAVYRAPADIIDPDKLVSKLPSPRGCTCFSDVLGLIYQDLGEDVNSDDIVITFFTDGSPVVPWSKGAEIERVGGFCKNIANENSLLAINSVGFSRYYDEEILKLMSSVTSNSFILHAERIEELAGKFEASYHGVEGLTSTRWRGKVGEGTVAVISANARFNNVLSKDSFDLRLSDAMSEAIFFVSDGHPNFVFTDEFGDEHIFEDRALIYSSQSELPRGLLDHFKYAYAAATFQSGKRSVARDLMARNVSDRRLVDVILGAFTRADVAVALAELNDAVADPGKRLVEGGCPPGYVPSSDGLCVLELLHALSDTDCVMYPYHEQAGQYTRITAKSEDTDNRFIMPEEIASTIEVVTSKKNFNASVRVTINGHVRINKKTAERVGLPELFPASTFRNYAVIKDGGYNMDRAVFKLTDEFRAWAKDNEKRLGKNFISELKDGLQLISFKRLPLSNSLYQEGFTANDLAQAAIREVVSQCARKAIRHVISVCKDKPRFISGMPSLTPDQVDVLKDHGVNTARNYIGVAVKTPSVENCDSYQARYVQVQVKGCSTIPPVEKTVEKSEKIKEGGKGSLNFCENIILHVLAQADGLSYEQLSKIEQSLNRDIRLDNDLINQVLMSKVSTGDWFEDLEVDEKDNEFVSTSATSPYYEGDLSGIVYFKPVMDTIYFTVD